MTSIYGAKHHLAQSIAASQAGIAGISTTYVTGTLVTAVTRLFASRRAMSALATRNVTRFTARRCFR
jgi:hypothetical protein